MIEYAHLLEVHITFTLQVDGNDSGPVCKLSPHPGGRRLLVHTLHPSCPLKVPSRQVKTFYNLANDDNVAVAMTQPKSQNVSAIDKQAVLFL